MKLPWKKREPQDLVGEQVAEAQARTDLYPPANHWSNWASPDDAGILFLPEEINFPTTSSGSLTASGGWCAPKEVIYGMELAMRSGGHPASAVPLMVEIPAVQVARGGVKHPTPRRRPAPPRPDHAYPNPAFLAASVANPGLLPLAFMKDPTAP